MRFKLLALLFFVSFHIPAQSDNEPPKSTLDLTLFYQHGCVQVEEYKTNCGIEPAHMDCTKSDFAEKWRCTIEETPSELSGLGPKVPIAECDFGGNWHGPTNDGIVYLGCGLAPIYRKYVVYYEGDFKIVNNTDEFRALFAPVETPEEALAFAMAFTTSYPLYKINIPKGYVKEAKVIASTFVESTDAGYKVHLFGYQCGGCGPHHYYAVDYLVTKEGAVSEISKENIYRNPVQDTWCID